MNNKLGKALILTLVIVVLYSVHSSAASQSRQQIAQGEKLYMTYCASCHGADGSGNLARASALEGPPPDLRRIHSRYGKFSVEEMRKTVTGKGSLSAHRKGDMPVWGMVLKSADINRLVDWLQTIQRPFDPTPAAEAAGPLRDRAQ